MYGLSGSTTRCQICRSQDANAPNGNAFWFDSQLPLDPNGHAKDIDLADDLDARELEEDMKTAAGTRLRFFGRCIAQCTLEASIIVDIYDAPMPP
jgi:hypothetical protein